MKIASTAAGLLIVAAATAAAEDLGGLGGLYDAAGTNFNGSRYSGTVGILPTSTSTCRIKWKIGASEYDGICMRSGDTFVATYRMRNVAGLIAYKIKSDGSLDGTWTIADQKGTGTEKLTPQRKSPLR